MNQSIKVIIPKDSNVPKKIRDTYNEYYKEWKIENPNSRGYPISKLRNNIRKALSVNGRVLNENYFKVSNYNPWKGRTVLFYSHWYFLVRFQQNLFGEITAIIEDALYEGDYHNDTMNTKPYGEIQSNNNQLNCNINMNLNKKVVRLTESQLHNIIAESVNQILNEIGDTFRGQYMLGRLKGRKEAQGDEKSSGRVWDYARKERAKRPFKSDRANREDAFNRGFQNQLYHDRLPDGNEKIDAGYGIRRDLRQYKSFDEE